MQVIAVAFGAGALAEQSVAVFTTMKLIAGCYLIAAILPQFVTGAGAGIAPQIMFLGLLFVTIAVLSDTVWVLAASRLRSWLSGSPRRLEAVGGAGGIAIAALGTGLLVTGRKG